VDEAANLIRAEVDPDANIIVGSTFSHELEGKMRVSVVATGIEAEEILANRPTEEAITRQSEISLGASTPSSPAAKIAEPQHETLFGGDEIFEAVQNEDSLKARASKPKRTVSSVLNRPPENPVGTVRDHIKKMLTEDEEKRAAERANVSTHGKRAGGHGTSAANPMGHTNPFRGRGPLGAAMDILRETFSGPEGTDEKKPIPHREGHNRPISRSASAHGAKSHPKTALKPAIKPLSQNHEELFPEEDGADLEIPAFLRRRGDR